jgi:hypothetical protein
MSLDGYVAKQDNTIGRLFDWLQNGSVAIPTPAEDFTVHLAQPSAEHWTRWVPQPMVRERVSLVRRQSSEFFVPLHAPTQNRAVWYPKRGQVGGNSEQHRSIEMALSWTFSLWSTS